MSRRTSVAVAAATGIYAVSSAASAWVSHPATELSSGASLLELLGASLACAGVMTWLVAVSHVPAFATGVRLFALGAIIDLANIVEAFVFDVATGPALGALTAIGLVTHAVAVASIIRIIDTRASSADHTATISQPAAAWWWVSRVAALGVLYAITYFVAGATIYPFVRAFYEAKPLPPPGTVFALQVLVRGPAFAVVGALVVSIVGGSRMQNALAVGGTLAGIGGLCALLHPNPLFPTHVRFVHLAEVTTSNLVFGIVVGLVLSRAVQRTRSASRSAHAA